MVTALGFLVVLCVLVSVASLLILSRRQGLRAVPTVRSMDGSRLPLLLDRTVPAPRPETRFAVEPSSRLVKAVPSKAQAEDLLDWLEANGFERLEVSYQPGEGCFLVRCERGRRSS